jgi:hypothetical protein
LSITLINQTISIEKTNLDPNCSSVEPLPIRSKELQLLIVPTRQPNLLHFKKTFKLSTEQD